MDVTFSTLISLLALAVAGLSVGYTRQRAKHAAAQVAAAKAQVAEVRRQSKDLRRKLMLELADRSAKERPTGTA
jgi:hypothetical protein